MRVEALPLTALLAEAGHGADQGLRFFGDDAGQIYTLPCSTSADPLTPSRVSVHIAGHVGEGQASGAWGSPGA